MGLKSAESRTIVGRMGEIVIVSATTALAVFLVFFALSWASLGADRTAMTNQVRAAFASGELRPDASWLFGDTVIGVHQYNDCLILFQAIDDRAPRLERAVSPLSTVPSETSSCTDLQRLIDTGAGQPPYFYHRYLHGHTTLARLLVPTIGVAGLRGLYKLTLSLVLLAGTGFAMLEIARRRRVVENAVWLIIFAVFARYFGLESFGQSLSHAPADLTVLGFVLLISRASADRPISRRLALIVAALFGALTIEFEFLTGGLPLGLAVTIGALPLALAADGKALTTAADAAVSFAVGVATCLIGKAILLVAVFGTAPLTETAGQFLFRTGLSHAANRDQPAGWGEFFSHTYAGLESLAPGMPWLAIGSLALALGAGIWGYRLLRRDADAGVRARATALAGSNVVLLLWMVLFWQHTAEHAWFIDRILAWTLASGFALFFLAVATNDHSSALPTAHSPSPPADRRRSSSCVALPSRLLLSW